MGYPNKPSISGVLTQRYGRVLMLLKHQQIMGFEDV